MSICRLTDNPQVTCDDVNDYILNKLKKEHTPEAYHCFHILLPAAYDAAKYMIQNNRGQKCNKCGVHVGVDYRPPDQAKKCPCCKTDYAQQP